MLLVTKHSKPQGELFQSQISCSKLGLSATGNRRTEFSSLLFNCSAPLCGLREGENMVREPGVRKHMCIYEGMFTEYN